MRLRARYLTKSCRNEAGFGRKSISWTLSLILIALVLEPAIRGIRMLERERILQEYEAFLEQHPFNHSNSGVNSREDPQNPGERYQHEFLLTMNPDTRTVPRGKLVEADRRAADLRRRGRSMLAQTLTTGWTERGPTNVGGRTRAIMFDPTDTANEKVFAGGVAGGLWYTNDITDSNEPWHNVDDFWSNIAVSTIAYDPSNTSTWYVGTGEGYYNVDALRGGGIFKSTDAGATWSHLPSTNGTAFTAVQKIVVTSTGVVLAATRDGDGVQRSTNGGVSWTTVLDSGTPTPSTSSRAADLEIAANGDIYASLGLLQDGQVFKSTNNGLTWSHVFGDPTGTNPGSKQFAIHRIEIAVAPSDANRVYVIAQNSSSYGVDGMWRSTDAGATWASMPTPTDCDSGIGSDISRGQAWYDLILRVNPTDEDDLIVGGIDLFRTTSAGTTVNWTQLTRWANIAGCGNLPIVHADQHALEYRPGSSQALVNGNDGGVYYTANVQTPNPTFVNRNYGYNVTQFYAIAQRPDSADNLIVGGTQDNGTQRSSAQGAGDATEVIGGDGAFTHVSQTTGILGFGSTQYVRHYVSNNGGSTFSFIGAFSGGGSFINPSDLDEDPEHLYFNWTSSVIARLNPPFVYPVSANTIGPPGGFGSTPRHLRSSEFSPPGTSTVYVGTNAGRIYRGTDLQSGGSQSWSQINSLPPASPGAISSIEFLGSEDTMAVTISSYGRSSVWLTRDGGSSWADLDAGSNLPDMPVWWSAFHPDDPRKLFIGTEAGLWYTEDMDANPVDWSVDPDIPITRVVMLRYRPSDRQLLAATHGRGTFTTTIPAAPGGTEPVLTAKILLEGAYAGSGAMGVSPDYLAAVPLQQPFSDPIFNGTVLDYDGTESVASLPAGTIDWVLVSLRTGIAAATEVPGSERPAFVLDDGSVVGLDGGALAFTGVAAGSYRVVIRQRNHLPVMSNVAIDFTSGPGNWDFTTSQSQAHSSTGPAMREVETGVFALIGCDGTVDGQITANDLSLFLAETTAATTGYFNADFNLDALSTVLDYNILFYNTRAAYSSQIPE